MLSQVKTFEGMLDAKGLRFGIVCARFNDFFVSELLSGALDTIRRLGGDPANIDVAWVPGSFEIPLVISKMMDSGKYDATIALGGTVTGEHGVGISKAPDFQKERASALSTIDRKSVV